jgi:hypothetical protein
LKKLRIFLKIIQMWNRANRVQEEGLASLNSTEVIQRNNHSNRPQSQQNLQVAGFFYSTL